MVDNALTILRWGIGLVLIFFTWFIISEGIKKFEGNRMADAIAQAEQDVSDDPLSTKSVGTLTDGVTDSIKEMGGKDSELKFWERCRRAVHRALDEGTEFTKRFWEEKADLIKNVAHKLGEGLKKTIVPVIQPIVDFFYGIFIEPLVNSFWGSTAGSSSVTTPTPAPEPESIPQEETPKAVTPSSPRVPRKQVERDPSGLFN